MVPSCFSDIYLLFFLICIMFDGMFYHTFVCAYVCTYVYLCVCVCVCVCVCADLVYYLAGSNRVTSFPVDVEQDFRQVHRKS